MSYQILVGDNRATLKTLADNSVHVIITSPPYFALRKYSGDEAGIQVGAESDPETYIASLVEIFEECKRVLRNDGTLFLNLGDSFSGSGGAHKKGGKNPGLSKSSIRSGATEDEAPHTYRAGGAETSSRMRLRHDLTDEQVNYVLAELVRARVISSNTQDGRS